MSRRKKITFRYNGNDFDPPAPALDVYISPPIVHTQFHKILGQIDTGADGTCLPESFARQINLRVVGKQKARDFHGREVMLNAYLAIVKIPPIFEDTIRIIGTSDTVALIGRDIFNRLHLNLDGPKQTFVIAID
jgi:predicted aspartyl protease